MSGGLATYLFCNSKFSSFKYVVLCQDYFLDLMLSLHIFLELWVSRHCSLEWNILYPKHFWLLYSYVWFSFFFLSPKAW